MRIGTLARDREGSGWTQVEVFVDEAVCTGVLVLGNDVAVAQAREQCILKVAVVSEVCTHVDNTLQHFLVEADLLCGVKHEKHKLLTTDGIRLQVDGRSIAIDDT